MRSVMHEAMVTGSRELKEGVRVRQRGTTPVLNRHHEKRDYGHRVHQAGPPELQGGYPVAHVLRLRPSIACLASFVMRLW